MHVAPRVAPRRLLRRASLLVGLVGLVVLVALSAGCGASATGAGGGIHVVAAENFWGSIAAQLAGTRASVQSIIVAPAQDPHSYEPSAANARALAGAQLVIVNGVDYDQWSARLLAANPSQGRIVLTVGRTLHLADGANPHRWYDPSDVELVAAAITRDLQKLDPRHRAYYSHRHANFLGVALRPYHAAINRIRQRYAGVPVGASESIFALLAPSLGLRLITPATFMNAVSEGSDLTAQDALTVERQITAHRIKVWVYNPQNATPEIQRLNALARTNHIPLATITETLAPASLSFEQWQVTQLRLLERALHSGTGR